MLADGVREYPQTSRGFIVGTNIDLNSTFGDGDNMKRYSARVGSKVSCDFTPFSKIRITYAADYYRGTDGLEYVGDVFIYNTNRSQIKAYAYGLGGGYLTEATSDIDISSINQQAFFALYFYTTRDASGGTAHIKRIEFIN